MTFATDPAAGWDIALDCTLLSESGLVDVRAYRRAAQLGAGVDPIRHYLVHGWRAGLEPRAKLEINWLYPYFCSVGLDDAPALTFLTLRSAGSPVFSSRRKAEKIAGLVRASGLFDADDYAARAGVGDLDPALHYVTIGESMGIAPSPRFDPDYYRSRYPDIMWLSQGSLVHYVTRGRREGRRITSAAEELSFDRSRIDPLRETILIVTHEASRTGAPILAYNIAKRLRTKYNVVSLLLGKGDITQAFANVSSAVVGPIDRNDRVETEGERIVHRLLAAYRFSYVIANSFDSRAVYRTLARAFVPVVALVHEFAANHPPKGDMGRQLGWATEIVFSAERVAAAMREEFPSSRNYKLHVLPQGPSELPPDPVATRSNEGEETLSKCIRPAGYENALIVLGCGTIIPRKGVDLFLSCAEAVAALKPKRRVRFVWIGQRLPPEFDRGYLPSLLKQLSRCSGNAVILDEVADLEPAYAEADVFFLSSRLDPLPNVAIDSALRGLPIICFAECSGIADILAADQAVARSVVPHLDVNAAAGVIARLANDEGARGELGTATRRLAEATFDIERYVVALDRLGRQSMRIMQQRREDFATIAADETFDASLFLGPEDDILNREDAIKLFIIRMAMSGPRPQSALTRRPGAGFHPYIYVQENRDRYDVDLINPLAHFIRAGKPAGPWLHDVITPEHAAEPTAEKSALGIAMHVHFHYPELCAELLDLMSANSARCDLLLTTNSPEKAEVLEKTTASYQKGAVRISIVPNSGRDIGAFISGLDRNTIEQYDIIGHLHSKRSLSLGDDNIGERWRTFMWRNLVGGPHPMMDIVLARMARDTGLGLVFPEEPHLSDWDENMAIATELARQMGLRKPLPPFIDFPVGTMFWARTAALTPLFELGLTWDSYPDEPVPVDGTILHALERLLPFAAEHGGYRYATTHVPGVTR